MSFKLATGILKSLTIVVVGVQTVFIGLGFIAAGLLLYYTEPPKPVYGPGNNKISEATK